MKIASTKYLRKHDWTWYKDLIGKCSNPHCKSDCRLEVHHIIPLYQGGEDTISNCVVLCADCHNGLKLHGGWEYCHIVVLNWKIKSDNDIHLNDISLYLKEKIISTGFVCDKKLLEKEQKYKKLQMEKHIIKEMEYKKCKSGFNQCCIDYKVYHDLIESQMSVRW